MTLSPQPSIQDRPPELVVVWDLRDDRERPRLRAELNQQKRAWGRGAAVEMLGWRVFALVVSAGGALELGR